MLHEGVDLVNQFLDVGERSAVDGLLDDEAEPALHLVDPGGVGRGVVHVMALSPAQPGLDLGMLVGGVVVDHEMDVEMGRHAGVDMPQEGEEFLVPVAPLALGEHFSGGDIESKLTQDDGTARDKVARAQRLRALRDEAGRDYDVIACIAGRGFKARREDMRRFLQATDGKVFTLTTMHLLIDYTRIRDCRIR